MSEANYFELFCSQILDDCHAAVVLFDLETNLFYNVVLEGSRVGSYISGLNPLRIGDPISTEQVKKLADESNDIRAKSYQNLTENEWKPLIARKVIVFQSGDLLVDMDYLLCVPSIHAQYHDESIVIDFTGKVRSKSELFPIEKEHFLIEWVKSHSKEIMNNHARVNSGKFPIKIETGKNLMEAMQMRHSVRQYSDRSIGVSMLAELQAETDACNQESGLHIQLVADEPKAFSGFMAHYGKFSGVRNYFALIGKKTAELEEKCGYYGERLVLKAQQLGLNTCWVALTYSKVRSAYTVERGEKLCAVIAFGYGQTQGTPHRSKTYDEVASAENAPDWFQNGVKAALLAPTAVNQQKFHFTLVGDKVKAEAGKGMLTKMDLGIAKYHFEVGSGKSSLIWN